MKRISEDIRPITAQSDGSYRVQSRTQADVVHVVRPVGRAGEPVVLKCSCPAATFRGDLSCWHVVAVAQQMIDDTYAEIIDGLFVRT